MKNEQSWRLLQAIGEIRDGTVRDALPPVRRNLRPVVKWASLAAAVLICAGVMAAVMLGGDGLQPGVDTGTPTHAGITENTESTGWIETTGEPYPETSEQTTEETTVALTGMQTPGAAFSPVTSVMSPIMYSGPILPLTAEGNTDGLRAVRQLTLYTDSVTELWPPRFAVTDCYILENCTDTAKTWTLIYPYIGSVGDVQSAWPVIELRGGGKMETVTPRIYAGLGTGTYVGGGAGDPHTLNPAELDAPGEYEKMLEDGVYRKTAMDESDIGTKQVLDYRLFGIAIPADGHSERYQKTVLQPIIAEVCAEYRREMVRAHGDTGKVYIPACLDEELLYSVVYRELAQYGTMGKTPVDRWIVGVTHTLKDIIREIIEKNRVFYLSFEVTVPEDGYETVFIRQERTAAYDYRDMSMFRIDAVPALDTSLWLAAQDFIVPDGETYEIVRTSEEPQQDIGGISIPMKESSVWVDLQKNQ